MNGFRDKVGALTNFFSLARILEGMALSATVVDAGFQTLFQPIFMVTFYSLTTPLGIAVGIAINSAWVPNSTSALIGLGVIDSIAAGILIYDACVNLISANMNNSASFVRLKGWQKGLAFVCLWCGVVIMSIIGWWA